MQIGHAVDPKTGGIISLKLSAKTERELKLGIWTIRAGPRESIGARYDKRRKLLQAVKLPEGERSFILFLLGEIEAELIPEKVREALRYAISYQIGRGLDAFEFGTLSEVKAKVREGANFKPLWFDLGTDWMGNRYWILAKPLE